MKTLLLFIAVALNLSVAHAALPADLQNFPWKTGQVIAISEMIVDPTTFFFEAASGSRFGHTGVVVVNGQDVQVYEADPKLKGTGQESVDSFMARAQDGNGNLGYVILQPNLNDAQTGKLVKVLTDLVAKKIPYNFEQTYKPGAKTLNCSEFVFTAFQKAGIKDVGAVESVGDALNLRSMNGGVLELANQFGGGHIPTADEKVVSPLSVVKSPSLKVLKATLPIATELSDAEIFQQWKEGQGFLGMITFMNAIFSGMDPVTAFQQGKTNPDNLAQESQLEAQLLSGGALATKPFREFPANWRKD